MCKVYNTIGCLTAIKTHLEEHHIKDLNSLKDVLNFQKNYQTYQQEIISAHEKMIEQEKATLSAEILQLENTISADKKYYEHFLRKEIEVWNEKLATVKALATTSFFYHYVHLIKYWYYSKKVKSLENSLNTKMDDLIKDSVALHHDKTIRYQYITTRFKDAVNESSASQLKELQRKQSVINELNTFIYGAFGEHKVVKELENLSDEHFLINDFSLTFHPAIYNRQGNDYVKSIQIDHILISPAGVFLIETKNWSEKSLGSLDLHSPVQQVKRTGFALYKLFSGDIAQHRLKLNEHHWGNKKIPIKNIIVVINTKPNEEFQYVKVLTLGELLGYIQYFKPIFTATETETISNYLLGLNNMKHLHTKS